MKKFAIPALAATAALGIAGTAVAVDGKQFLKVSVSPSKAGTKAKPANVKIKVDTGVVPAATDKAFATTKTVLFFDKNLVFNNGKFPTCTQTTVQRAEGDCPTGSKVGSGSAQGKALGQTQNLKVSAFNGPNNQLLLHVTGSAPLQIDSVIVAKLSKGSGKYGSKLTVPIPKNLQEPVPGVFATLTSFVTSVKGTAKGVPYVGLKGCTGGKLNFAGDYTFTDGSKQSVTMTSKCS